MPTSSLSVPAPATLVALLQARAQQSPDRRAYLFLRDGEVEAGSLTYAELDARARTIAARLQTVASKGDRALLLYPAGLEFLAAFFGCLYAGIIAVPSYPPKRNRPDHRLQAIATDAGAKLILTDAGVLAELEARLTHTPELRALTWLATDTIAPAANENWVPPALTPDDLAFLQYTSGSTSTPKGVMVSHGNLLHNLDDLDRGWDHTADSVMVTWLPIFHDMGLIYGALMPLFKGFLCVMLPPPAFLQRPIRWLEAIARFKGTHSAAPNFAYDLCVSSTTPEQRATLDLRSWHLSLNAAEPVRAETLDAFNATFAPCGLSPLTISPGFGLAEATLKVCALPRSHPTRLAHVRTTELAQHRVVTGEPGATGVQPIVGCGIGQVDNRYLIVDPETHLPCAADAVGEIWFAGPSVARGYWNRTEETQQTFHARLASGDGPFMRTGDLGFMQAGEVFVTGRVKDMIIVRGLNHYPQDIELTVEKAHEALRPGCGAAFSVEINGREALVVAQEVERTHLRKLNVDEIVAAVRKAVVEKHELPLHALVLLKTGSIPKTSSGKIQRRACRQLFLNGELEVVGEWRLPASAAEHLETAGAESLVSLEAAVIETWLSIRVAQRLEVAAKEIDPHEPFSRYGLDSLAAIELSGALERWLGRRLSPTLVYDYPSIHALAEFLATAASNAPEQDPGAGVAVQPNEPIAIVGIGCRFPGADTPDEFWKLLERGDDAITRAPAERLHCSAATEARPWGGFLRQVDTFDADFFGISPREAELMDPQQRLLLEVTWEALEHAGLVPSSLGGTRTGVFIGISTHDYGTLLARHPRGSEAHAGTGNALSIAANRISYLLDLRGPSLALDTACSSSLVAIHHALRSLRAGESNVALVGAVNLLLAPDLTTTFEGAGMLAVDGRCKAFDASADGYGRGEGCGVVVLKRLSDAQRDGDRILALVRGSAVNQDGRSNGLTAPNGPAQQAVVRAAIASAQITPADLSYIETHGTGTSLGDPIEINSLREVLLTDRRADQPCWLGSVKTNIGHLEAAAGLAGLIKVVLALRAQKIPPHLHLRQVNPLIKIDGTPLTIPTATATWTSALNSPRLAGVSSFGFGGTNAHVILSEYFAPAGKASPSGEAPPTKADRAAHVLILSARTEAALRATAARAAAQLVAAHTPHWKDFCHTAATQRTGFVHRLALASDSAQTAGATLAAFSREGSASGLWSGHATATPRIAFLYSGQGSLYAGAGAELYASQPVYRAAVEACRTIIRSRAGWDIVEALASPEKLARTEFAQVALFTLEYALTQLWRSWGIVPDAVIGHSVGEYAAAVAAEVVSLDDALKLLIARAQLMGALDENGAMLAVAAGEDAVAAIAARNEVEIAGVNSPRQTVLTGRRDLVEAAAEEFRNAGVRVQDLGVRQGYHSRQMEPMLAAFSDVARGIRFASPTKTFVSTVTGAVATRELTEPAYWTSQVRQPVRFLDAARALHAGGATLLIEVGPRGILAALGQQSWPDQSATWLVSLQPNRSDWLSLLETAGRAFVAGAPIKWSEIDRGFSFTHIDLPTYPFQRQRHWFSDGPAADPVVAEDAAELARWIANDPALSAEDQAAAPRILAALQRARSQRDSGAASGNFGYEIRWPVEARAPSSAVAAGHWLLLGTAEAAAKTALTAAHQTFELANEPRAGSWRGVVLFAGNDSAEIETARLVKTVQGILAANVSAPLWVVTRGAVPISREDAKTLNLRHAPLWGVAKVIALEHRERWSGIVDLPLSASSAEWTSWADELLSGAGEDQVALRSSTRHVARLEPAEIVTRTPAPLKADGFYWVTGGLGGLGLHVAGWLVACGVKHLVLSARRPANAEAERVVAELCANGVRVLTVQADVADHADVQRVLAAIAKLAPLRGVIHAAGTVALDPLATMTPEALNAVLRAKVTGARVLHEATQSLGLDLFVLFSSIASVWGSRHQAHYAAANQYLDALAHHRRAIGMPALSVNWGPWSGGGMATDEAQAALARMGIAALPPEQMLAALASLLATGATQTAVARVDWLTFKELVEVRGPRPFLSKLGRSAATADESAAPTKVARVVEELAAAPEAERLPRLIAFLQREVASVLGYKDGKLPDPRQGFFEMGIDSLMAVELRNRLDRAFGRKFQATIAFDHANAHALATYLGRQVFGWGAPAPRAAVAKPIAAEPVGAVDENDLDAALARRLAKLEALVRKS